MTRIKRLVASIWIAVFATIVLFTLFWGVEYFAPHAVWGIVSVVGILLPLLWLAARRQAGPTSRDSRARSRV